MIKVQGLSKNFGKLKVLDNVNLSFNQGECVALIGPNGCGKTTLIKSILGMVLPTKGGIRFNDVPISADFEYRRQIGYMPQIGRYPDNMKIGQIIEMLVEIRQPLSPPDEHLLDAFRLREIFDKRMRTLSGGTTQKVSATLAFMFDPQVLILDEPTAGLDPLASEILKRKIIEERKKGKLILITSHLLSELDDLISHIVYMQEGQVRFHKTVNDLLTSTGQEKISQAITHILHAENEQDR